jgi:hypothetical protein
VDSRVKGDRKVVPKAGQKGNTDRRPQFQQTEGRNSGALMSSVLRTVTDNINYVLEKRPESRF